MYLRWSREPRHINQRHSIFQSESITWYTTISCHRCFLLVRRRRARMKKERTFKLRESRSTDDGQAQEARDVGGPGSKLINFSK